MIKTLPLVALTSLVLGTAAISTPVQANSICIKQVCTTTYKTWSVPNPTRRGNFISHFDAQGVPQSIVTPSETDTTCVEESNYPNNT